MRKFMKEKFFVFFILAFVIMSCVDNNYDLNKDISLDMSLGGDSISIPIGNTDSILLREIVEPSGMLKVDETGQYAIVESGKIDPVTISIDPVTISIDDILATASINLKNSNLSGKKKLTEIEITKQTPQ